MAHILAQDPIRELPIWQTAYLAGVDVGLAVALTALGAELAREDDRAAIAVATDPHTSAAATHQYAGVRLLAVGQILAGRFRQ
jgi:hypothetical protein